MIHFPSKYTDSELEEKIEILKKIVTSVIKKHSSEDENNDYSFTSYAEHYDDEPSEDPCVLVLCSDG